MSETLTIGWSQNRLAGSRRLYRTVLLVNIALYILIGLACLLAPFWISGALDLPGPIPSGWTRGFGALLLLLAGFYTVGWINPLTIRGPNLLGILGRFWMAIVWLLVGGGFAWLALFEFLFGLLVALLYFRLLRDELMGYP